VAWWDTKYTYVHCNKRPGLSGIGLYRRVRTVQKPLGPSLGLRSHARRDHETSELPLLSGLIVAETIILFALIIIIMDLTFKRKCCQGTFDRSSMHNANLAVPAEHIHTTIDKVEIAAGHFKSSKRLSRVFWVYVLIVVVAIGYFTLRSGSHLRNGRPDGAVGPVPDGKNGPRKGQNGLGAGPGVKGQDRPRADGPNGQQGHGRGDGPELNGKRGSEERPNEKAGGNHQRPHNRREQRAAQLPPQPPVQMAPLTSGQKPLKQARPGSFTRSSTGSFTARPEARRQARPGSFTRSSTGSFTARPEARRQARPGSFTRSSTGSFTARSESTTRSITPQASPAHNPLKTPPPPDHSSNYPIHPHPSKTIPKIPHRSFHFPH